MRNSFPLKVGEALLLFEVEAIGFEKGTVKRHGCPSHGVAVPVRAGDQFGLERAAP